MDYQALLYNPTQLLLGVPATLALGGDRREVTVIDKTSGIDTGDEVHGQTILPACVIRAQEVLKLGYELSALGLKNVNIEINNVWWHVVTYRLRPSPAGENFGEVYLLLSKAPIVAISTLTIPPPDFRDDTGLDLILEVFWDFGLLGANVNPDFLDDSALDAVMTVTTELVAALADDLGISNAQMTVVALLSAALADDLGISQALIQVGSDLVAPMSDDAGLDVVLTFDFNATFADDTGFDAVIGAFTLLSAAIADDTGLAAAITLITLLSAAMADDTGLAATITLGSATVDMSAAIADDIGLNANVTVVNGPPVFGSQSFVSPSGTSATIAYPSGISAGDLLMLVLAFGGTATQAITGLPAGWTIGGLNNNVGGNVTGSGSINTTYAWKIADGTETGNLTVGGWASQQVLTFLTRYHNVDPVYPLTNVVGARTGTFGTGALVSRGPNSTFVVFDAHVTGNFMNTVSGWTRQFVSGNVAAVFDVNPGSGSNVNSTAFSENAGGTYQQSMFELASYKNVQAMRRAGAALAPAASSFTFTAQAVGPAGANRTVFAILGCTNGQIPTGVLIGGVTATKVEGWADSTNIGASLWYAAVPTGTTADVAVTCGATVANAAVQVYTTYASFNATPIYSNHSIRGGSAGTDTFTFTPSSDGALVLAFDVGTTAVSPTGTGMNGDTGTSNASIAIGSAHDVVAAVSKTVNWASGATRAVRAVYVFAPV